MSRDLMRDDLEIWWNSYEDPWERLYDISRLVTLKNPDADFFDLFNFIRQDIFGGWKMDEDSLVIQRLDVEIDYEERLKDR